MQTKRHLPQSSLHHIFRQVIPEDAYKIGTSAYDGMFHARFWHFGKWEDVYIDDYLPIINGIKPWGAHSASDEDEMWVALLEKAFARFVEVAATLLIMFAQLSVLVQFYRALMLFRTMFTYLFINFLPLEFPVNKSLMTFFFFFRLFQDLNVCICN